MFALHEGVGCDYILARHLLAQPLRALAGRQPHRAPLPRVLVDHRPWYDEWTQGYDNMPSMAHRLLREAIKNNSADRAARALADDPSLATGTNDDGVPWPIVPLLSPHAQYLDIFQAGERARLLQVLFAHGADPNAINPKTGRALLIHMCRGLQHPHSDIPLGAVLTAGADPNCMDPDGWSPLMLITTNTLTYRPFLSAHTHDPIGMSAAKLLKAGADPNITSHMGRSTALHLAATKGIVPMCQALLDHGARVDVRDADGRRPSDLAKRHGHAQCAKMIADREIVVDSHMDMDVLTPAPEPQPATPGPRPRF